MRKQVLMAATGLTGSGAVLMSAGVLAFGLSTSYLVPKAPQEVGMFLISFGLVVFTLELMGLAEPIGVLLSRAPRRWAGLPPIGEPPNAEAV